MKIQTRVFDIAERKYPNLSAMAEAMGISVSQVYRVREGTRNINQKFIVGAVQAFPDYSLNDLFYVAGRDQGGHISPRDDTGDIEITGRR